MAQFDFEQRASELDAMFGPKAANGLGPLFDAPELLPLLVRWSRSGSEGAKLIAETSPVFLASEGAEAHLLERLRTSMMRRTHLASLLAVSDRGIEHVTAADVPSPDELRYEPSPIVFAAVARAHPHVFAESAAQQLSAVVKEAGGARDRP